MSLKDNIRKILLLAVWIVLGSSLLVLLVAAINIKNHKSCKGIDIKIVGVKNIFFLDKADIMQIVAGDGIPKPAGMAVTSFNLQRLESLLEKNIWVKDAELFFDNNLLLHINITEKEPVARVFANNGHSFYIDSSGSMMPLNERMNVKLPVFTGFPENRKRTASADSALLNDMKHLTTYILNDQFWMAQISQIDITEADNFELIPTIGNSVIEFGNGEDYESKFKRLLIFYKQVLSKTGLNTYSRISVQYNRQVIGTKKGTITKVDSVQALKNIQKMIEEARAISEDSVFAPTDKNIPAQLVADSMIMDVKMDSSNEVMENTLEKNVISKPATIKAKPAATSRSSIKPALTPAEKSILKEISKPTESKPIIKTSSKPADNKQANKAAPKQAEGTAKPKAVMGKTNN